MRLKELELTNYCQHSSLAVKFSPGITLISGRNGKGKSNVIKGAFRLLTGVSLNEGVKTADIKHGQTSGHGTLTFEVNNVEGTIKRHWDTARCNMTFGDKKYKTATEVDGAIYDIIGVNAKVLAEMVFVTQGKIEGVLFAKPSDRAKSFQVLFNTDGMETVRDLIKDEMEKIVVVSRKELIAQLREQLFETVEKPLAKANNELDSVSKYVLGDTDYKRCSDTVASYENYAAAAADRDRLNGVVLALQARLSASEGESGRLTEEQTAMSTMMTELRAAYEDAKVRVDHTATLAANKALRDQCLAAIKSADETLAANYMACPVSDSEVTTLRDESGSLRHHVLSSERIISTFSEGRGGGVCPTCMQRVPSEIVGEHIEKLKVNRPRLAELEAKFAAAESTSNKWRVERAKLTTQQEMARAARDSASSMLSKIKLPDVEASAEDHEMVKTYNDLADFVNNAASTLVILRNDIKNLKDNLANAQLAVSDNEAKAGVRVSDVDYKVAKATLAYHVDNVAKENKLKGSISTLEEQRTTLLSQIEKHEREEQGLAGAMHWQGLLEKSRVVLHRDNLPNLVARSYLSGINVAIAKYMELFGAPFQAMLKDDLSVECHFPGGFVQSAERLSGGQRVMLGLAFRFAVYDLFTSTLGVLIIDEPTVYLDDENIDCVFRLLETVKDYAKVSGLQVIVISHEPKLMPVFDHVIEVA